MGYYDDLEHGRIPLKPMEKVEHSFSPEEQTKLDQVFAALKNAGSPEAFRQAMVDFSDLMDDKDRAELFETEQELNNMHLNTEQAATDPKYQEKLQRKAALQRRLKI